MAFDKTQAAAVAAKWGPLVFVVIAIGTLLATWFTSYALGDDWGGLKVPYISDTAKTPPNYIVFAVGLTVSAAIYAGLAAMSALAAHALGAATGDARLRRLTWPTLVFAILAALGLALLAIFNTLVYPTAHLAFALMFFVCAMVWIGLDLAANRRWIGDAAAAAPPYRRRWLAKRIIAVGAYIAFVIYIPIGLTIVELTCPFVIDPATGYYDYTNCYGLNEMRVGAQYFSIVFIIAYITCLLPPSANGPTSSSSSSAGAIA